MVHIKFSLQDPTVSVITITPGVLVHIKFSVQDPTVSVITITPGVLVHIKISETVGPCRLNLMCK